MAKLTQKEMAERLLALHQGPEILVFANVWDCASARVVEEAGYPAIATSSAGVAFSLGYPDGQRIPRGEMLDAVKRIARCIAIPLTADLEGGYDDIDKTAEGLIEAGAVGLNLEDMEGIGSAQLAPVERQIERIRAVRRAGERTGIHVVINARTDLYLAKIGEKASRLERALDRLRAYRDAGADCLFVPGVTDESTIKAFVDELRFPINILATTGSPSVPRLAELGVRRVSVGSGIMRAAMGLMFRVAREIQEQGTFQTMLEGSYPYQSANDLFKLGDTQ
jgi:2-methylisocitrate lyase-like PEP mutase family enzyme